jgi:hypothetical protein
MVVTPEVPPAATTAADELQATTARKTCSAGRLLQRHCQCQRILLRTSGSNRKARPSAELAEPGLNQRDPPKGTSSVLGVCSEFKGRQLEGTASACLAEKGLNRRDPLKGTPSLQGFYTEILGATGRRGFRSLGFLGLH